MHRRQFLAAVSCALAIAGCDRAPKPARRGQVVERATFSHYDSLVGLADLRTDVGRVCLASPMPLDSNTEITLVSVPIRGRRSDSVLIATAHVVGRFDHKCVADENGVGVAGYGDSLYSLALATPGPQQLGPMFGVVAPRASFFTRGDSVTMRAPDGTTLAFDACTSQEGVHLSVWAGSPLTGQRVAHRYYYLPYGTEPNCEPSES